MKSFFVATLGLTLTLELPAQADTSKPNFTGVWKLREEVADVRATLPDLVQQIVHRGSMFEITVLEDGIVRIPREAFEIGAPDVRRPSSCCGDGAVRYWWEGSALHGTFVWAEGDQVDVRTLSTDGKLMRIGRTIKQPGEVDRFILWVFEKQ